MISKGLDFERLTVVGILDADNMMHFPDFRAHERSFQLMEQVSGRAGRRTRRGKVIIQTADPANVILRQVLKHDFKAMSSTQLEERSLFGYPPFTRIIRIALKHRDLDELNASAARLAGNLRRQLGTHRPGSRVPHGDADPEMVYQDNHDQDRLRALTFKGQGGHSPRGGDRTESGKERPVTDTG